MGMAATSVGGAGSRRVHHHGGGPKLRRFGIGLFFASVAVNAALGITALVVGNFSETQGRILGTSLSVTGAVLLALACLPAWERGRLGLLPVVGTAVGVVAFGLVIVSIWTGGDSEVLGKVVGTAMAPAVASALACLLAYPALAPEYRPVLRVALGLIAVAAAMAVLGIWLEPESSLYPRAFGVVAVLLAATAVSIPVLARLSRAEVAAGAVEPVAFCPYCGARVVASATVSCASCGRAFTVRPAML